MHTGTPPSYISLADLPSVTEYPDQGVESDQKSRE